VARGNVVNVLRQQGAPRPEKKEVKEKAGSRAHADVPVFPRENLEESYLQREKEMG